MAKPTGGGIDNAGTLTVTNSTITDNNAIDAAGIAYGGGIYNTGTATLTDVTVAGNHAGESTGGGNGGGIYNTGTMTVTDCTFFGNNTVRQVPVDKPPAARAAAIYNDGTVSLTATTVSSNVALYQGGGIANFPGTLTLADTIVAGNTLPCRRRSPDILGSVAAAAPTT